MLKLDLQTFASVDEQTVHAGHTILIKIGNDVVGKAQGVEGDRSFGTEGVYEIGSIMPGEHIPLRYEGSFSLERFFVRTGDLAALGYGSLNEDVLKKGVFTFEVLDKYTRRMIRAYHGCTIVNYRETFRVNAIAGENATFTYMYAKSGADTSSN
ncbi:hypothetical protein D3C74_54930 [compost metagenome]